MTDIAAIYRLLWADGNGAMLLTSGHAESRTTASYSIEPSGYRITSEINASPEQAARLASARQNARNGALRWDRRRNERLTMLLTVLIVLAIIALIVYIATRTRH